jgi:hypothetical protein
MAKISEILASGVGGVLPVLMARDYEKQKAQEAAEERDKAASVGNVGTSGNVGAVSKMASGGMTASKRADGCAQRGKTKGRMV